MEFKLHTLPNAFWIYHFHKKSKLGIPKVKKKNKKNYILPFFFDEQQLQTLPLTTEKQPKCTKVFVCPPKSQKMLTGTV